MQRLGLACLLWIVGALAACSEPSARPPGVQSRCDGSANCGPPGTLSGGGVDAGAGETGTAAGIQVVIRELYDTVLGNAQPFLGTVRISALDSEGLPLSDEFDTTASSAKNLELLGGSSVWVTVTPLSSSQDLVTLQNIDTTRSPKLTLYLARSSMVDDILALGGFTQVLTTDPTAAQVLVYFVNAGDVGVANVSVTVLTATPILYAEGGVWSDLSGQTDGSGQVLLINVPVSDGGLASLGYTANGVVAADAGGPAEITFPVAAGAVTLLTVVIAQQ